MSLEERELRFVDYEQLDTTGLGPIEGSNAQCLADSLLDILQVSLMAGMTEQDVDEALEIMESTRARLRRTGFRLLEE